MKASITERAGKLCSQVDGRFSMAHRRDNGTFSTQEFKSEWRPCASYGENALIRVEVRFDDNCGNGHNSFSICGTIRDVRYSGDRGDIAGGQCVKEIAEAFPELVPLLKWHLFDTTGPMHYVGNTVYLAGDRGYNGLRAGERRQLVNGRTGLPVWELVAIRNGDEKVESVHTLPTLVDAAKCPTLDYVVQYLPCWAEGKGKERELDAARRTAVWPEATDEELCADPEILRLALEHRLPDLLVNFRSAMILAGFEWD